MKTKILFSFFAFVLLIATETNSSVLAQCFNSNGWNNITLFWNDQSFFENWGDEYTTVSGIQANQNYQISENFYGTSAYITITDESNNVLSTGFAPLVWNSGSTSGNIRIHSADDLSCFQSWYYFSIQCLDCPEPPLDPCVFNSSGTQITLFGNYSSTLNAGGCQYVTYNGIQSNNDYSFTGSSYATITDEDNNVLLWGYLPLSWNSGTYSGSVRVHLSTNQVCGCTGGSVTAQCVTCPVPPPTPCFNATGWNSVTLFWNDPAYFENWGNEYTTVFGIQSNQNYQISENLYGSTGFVTITDEANNVLFFDFAPFVWNSGTYSGAIRLHSADNPSCNQSFYYFYIQCLDCPEPPLDPCVYTNSGTSLTLFGNYAATLNAGGCQYVTFNGVEANNDYQFTGFSYATITDDNNNVLTWGYLPLSWNSGTYSGSIRVHLSNNQVCGCNGGSVTAQCLTCPVPPPTPCLNSSGWYNISIFWNDPVYIDNWGDEYVTIDGILANQDYQISENLNGPSMFVTITDEFNNVLFFDFAPFIWNSGSYSGTIRIHTADNPSCMQSWYYMYIQCLTCPMPPLAPCVYNSFSWSQTTLIANYGSTLSSGGCDYVIFDGIQANNTYSFTGSSYATITDANNNVLLFGFLPLSWNSATYTGSIHVHLSNNQTCGCNGGTVTAQCLTCPVPPPTPCFNNSGWNTISLFENQQNYFENWGDEYTTVFNIQAWNNYQISENFYGSSVFVTITDESNNVLFFDYAPFTWNSGSFSGTIRIHTADNPSCAVTYYYMYAQCLTCLCNPGPQPSISCWETAVLNSSTCTWVVSGTQPAAPTNLSCWQTATFNNASCSWVISGTQPQEPTNLSCWQTATFDDPSCSWVVSGTQPQEPTNLACYQVATFNNMSCSWVVSGTEPVPTFNNMGPYCVGASIPPLPTTSTNNISGTWSPAINNQTTTTYTFTPAAGECASTASITIVIETCGNIDEFVLDDENTLLLVPNPTNAITTLHFNALVELGTITVFDALGRFIQSDTFHNSESFIIDASHLEPGVYFVVLSIGNVNRTCRLVVSK